MRKIVISLATSLLPFTFIGCEQPTEPTPQDWNETSKYFASVDEKVSTTYYKPDTGFIGDPMPFYDPINHDFKVLYLQEYRPNKAGTYHPFWGLQTTDAANYTPLGEVLPTGSRYELDAALGTGSVVYSEADKLYYIFYTANPDQPKAGEDVQLVMYATSPDFKTWTKNTLFRLRGVEHAYSRVDFRDPCLWFMEEDGLWHMLVATKAAGKGGTLAEFTSPDLKTWENKGAFMSMMWDRFYECPDVFKMGDWWYLVYSEKHSAIRRVQYFKGRTLDELKACTANDAGRWPDSHEGFLDSRAFYAGKTASDGTNRYIWGWCPTREGNDNVKTNSGSEPQWAGSLVAHRLIQHEDGSLTLGEVDGIKAKYNNNAEIKVMEQSSKNAITINNAVYTFTPNSYALFNRLGYHNHISMTVTTTTATDKFGISFVRGSDSDKYYTVVVNPEGSTRRKINFEEEGAKGIGSVDAIDGYMFDTPKDNVYKIDIYTDNSVMVLYINNNVAYTNRIYGIQRNCWSINSYDGNIMVSDLKITTY